MKRNRRSKTRAAGRVYEHPAIPEPMGFEEKKEHKQRTSFPFRIFTKQK